jgi:hypothetical protein
MVAAPADHRPRQHHVPRHVFAVSHIGFVLASDALTVTRNTVQGNQRMSRGEVLGLLG